MLSNTCRSYNVILTTPGTISLVLGNHLMYTLLLLLENISQNLNIKLLLFLSHTVHATTVGNLTGPWHEEDNNKITFHWKTKPGFRKKGQIITKDECQVHVFPGNLVIRKRYSLWNMISVNIWMKCPYKLRLHPHNCCYFSSFQGHRFQ